MAENKGNKDKTRMFVARLYKVCHDREPEEEGLNYWTDILFSGEMTGSEVAGEFIFSKEFKEKNYCNSCYLKHLYKAFFGREYEFCGSYLRHVKSY